MQDLSIKLDDLPDEILIYIFKKLYNHEVLYSLAGINERLNRIVYDKMFTRDLCLLRHYSYDDSIFPLLDSTIDQYCSKILPDIGHKIESLFLEQTSIERVLQATNYPNLNHLGLCDVNYKVAISLFGVNNKFGMPVFDDQLPIENRFVFHLYLDKNPFNHLFVNQISSLFINFINEKISLPPDVITPFGIIFKNILATFTNLRCLKLNPTASFDDYRSFLCAPVIPIYSTLIELHISLRDMDECLCILDKCFDQLRIFNVTLYEIDDYLLWRYKSEQKPLPNLRIFSLSCIENVENFDETIVLFLRRMLNLEELHLHIVVECYEKFIDGDTLNKDIIIYMPRLYNFTFNIWSIIDHRYQTNFPLNEDIQRTFEYFSNNQTITSIDHFQEEKRSECHIYSYPYIWKFYNNISNNFQGGLFTSVTEVSLYDEHPFELEFFLRITQSFPLMKKLVINNRKAQNNKQISSIIEYPNLTRLDLSDTHDDYVELFLFDTKISLPNNLHICIEYQSLQRVTDYFTRDTTRNNCEKLAVLYFHPINQIDERFNNYFPHTRIRHSSDFLSIK